MGKGDAPSPWLAALPVPLSGLTLSLALAFGWSPSFCSMVFLSLFILGGCFWLRLILLSCSLSRWLSWIILKLMAPIAGFGGLLVTEGTAVRD